MTISEQVIHSVMCLEEIFKTRWINRALIVCPDNVQCLGASYLLKTMDYTVETVLVDDITDERSNFYSSIERLRKGLSKVLVTTPETVSYIQKNLDTMLRFDVVL